MIRRVLGRSACQSPNAAAPSSRPVPVWAHSGIAARATIAAAIAARHSLMGRAITCSGQGSKDEQAELYTVPSVMSSITGAATRLEIPRRLRALVRARESSLIGLAALVGAIAGLVVAGMGIGVDILHEVFFQLEHGERLSA